MIEKRERRLRATLVFAEDGQEVLSAFSTIEQSLVDDDGTILHQTTRDVDLNTADLKTLFGATIDGNLREIKSRQEAAEARIPQLETDLGEATMRLTETRAQFDEAKRLLEVAQGDINNLLAQAQIAGEAARSAVEAARVASDGERSAKDELTALRLSIVEARTAAEAEAPK